MSTAPSIPPPILANGDRMSQPEFHRRYLMYPDDTKFELIGGIVYMASPLRQPHSVYHSALDYALVDYAAHTPGIEVGNNATTILGRTSEPQPDLFMRILAEYGGRTSLDKDKYIVGPPELLVEVAHSSRAIDLHGKRDDYFDAGVLEYFVLCVEEKEIRWFHFPSDMMIEPNRQGIHRSQVFPGLWIDGAALWARDILKLREVVQRGLASREHTAFVKKLEAARRMK